MVLCFFCREPNFTFTNDILVLTLFVPHTIMLLDLCYLLLIDVNFMPHVQELKVGDVFVTCLLCPPPLLNVLPPSEA